MVMKMQDEYDYSSVCAKLDLGLELASSIVTNLEQLTRNAQAICPDCLPTLPGALSVVTLALDKIHHDLGYRNGKVVRGGPNGFPETPSLRSSVASHAASGSTSKTMVNEDWSQGPEGAGNVATEDLNLIDLLDDSIPWLNKHPPMKHDKAGTRQPKIPSFQLSEDQEPPFVNTFGPKFPPGDLTSLPGHASHQWWVAVELPKIKWTQGRKMRGFYRLERSVPAPFDALMSVMRYLDLTFPERQGIHGNHEVNSILANHHLNELRRFKWANHRQLVKAAKDEGLLVGEHDYLCRHWGNGWYGGWCGEGWIAVNRAIVVGEDWWV